MVAEVTYLHMDIPFFGVDPRPITSWVFTDELDDRYRKVLWEASGDATESTSSCIAVDQHPFEIEVSSRKP